MPHAQTSPSESATKVVLGLSGGVDSAVAAHLLMRDGFEVHAVYLKNWTEKDENGVCPAERDRLDAMRVAAKLGIPFRTVDYEREYRDRVFAPFLAGLERGLTPNPDMLCNPLVKFEALCAIADEIGAPWVATGHYARNIDGKLFTGKDPQKDQSYFLSRITHAQLQRSLFPIGEYTKPKIRQIAREIGLHVADKEGTSGICFIGERNFETFLRDRVAFAPGPVVTIKGQVVAEHHGLPFYTVGQRHGFGGGGGLPYYVADKRSETNTLVVAPAYDPALMHGGLMATDVHWINRAPALPAEYSARIRYRQTLQECAVIESAPGALEVSFRLPQRAITPGQYVAFYDGECCLGSAMISAPTL